jgi:hypothetical protein
MSNLTMLSGSLLLIRNQYFKDEEAWAEVLRQRRLAELQGGAGGPPITTETTA